MITYNKGLLCAGLSRQRSIGRDLTFLLHFLRQGKKWKNKLPVKYPLARTPTAAKANERANTHKTKSFTESGPFHKFIVSYFTNKTPGNTKAVFTGHLFLESV